MYPFLLKHRHCAVLICCLLASSGPLWAQLVADFSMDRPAGCSPLAVLFNNKTTGASPAAKYSWNFGNGNTSTLFSPGATYRTEQTYTVTLTVADKGLTATKTAQVVVYKAPTVSFTTSATKGCLPLQVAFTSNSTAGAGAITNYVWDFGNGNVVQGVDKETLHHVYSFAQQHGVSLTVTNSYGCFTALDKPALIEAVPSVKADFTMDKKALCAQGDAVQFTNASTGSGFLYYLWDFGDGTTSNSVSPKHVYAHKGAYTVKLTVTGSNGCSDTKELTNAVNVDNFLHKTTAPQLICSGSAMQFAAESTPAADSVRWDFGPGMPLQKAPVVHPVFQQAGPRTIKLTSYWGGCAQTATMPVHVAAAPTLHGIEQVQLGACRLPVTFKFKDTTAGAAAWQWHLAGEPLQTGQEAQFTFAAEGQHLLQAEVRNAAGCAARIKHTVAVQKPTTQIKVAASSSRFGTADCVGLKLKFKAEGSMPIKTYHWDLGDGTTSADSLPEHTYQRSGKFTVVLHYTAIGGCSDTAMYQYVSVYSKPKIDFTGPTEVCSSNPVGFKAITDTAVRQFYWSFYTGANLDTATNINNYIETKYMQEGVYTIKLYANNGACADSVVKVNYLKVNPPFQWLYSHLFRYDCNQERNKITTSLYTRGAAMLVWNWGDGAVDSIPHDTKQKVFWAPHTYAQPGVYKAYYSTINGQCIARDSTYIAIPGKQSPTITANKSFVCLNDNVEITISGVNLLGVRSYWLTSEYSLKELRYADGTPFNGTIQVLDSNWATGFKAVLSGISQSNSKGLRVFIVSNISGCVDSSNVLSITFSGPKAGIAPVTPACFAAPVVFNDAAVGNNIQKWEWSFGDTSLTQTTAGAVLHQYSLPGVYPVSLTVTDADGCTDKTTVAAGVRVLGVKAAFQLPDTLVAFRTPVLFTNTSTVVSGAAAQYRWTYNSHGNTATTQNITHTYPNIGRDTIQLIAETLEGNCSDTAVQVLHIDNIHAKFSYEATYINGNACPPMLVKFQNLSRNSRRNLWHFGDGSTARDQNNPERTYQLGGTYTVTLYTFGPGGIVDSASQQITVKGPSASLSADKYFGCLNQQVVLSAKVQFAQNYYWDYGDGTVLHTRDTFALHHYQTAGVYTPSLVMSDSTGCSVAAELAEPVVIDSLHVAIGGIPGQICDAATLTLQPQVVSVAADRMGKTLDYNWASGNSTANTAGFTKAFAGEGKYGVQVNVKSPYGCVQTAYDTVRIYRTVRGTIKGNEETCEGSPVQFTASVPDAAATWSWLLPDGTTTRGLQTPVQSFKDSGFYPIRLAVLHDGCSDTAATRLWVHANPDVTFANPTPSICLGKSIQLTAGGGAAYQWSSAQPIQGGAATAQPVVAPRTTSWYSVTARSVFGCYSTDSIQVHVAQPFRMAPLADTFVCRGLSVQLAASGAHTYQWSGPANTLRNERSAVAIASPVRNALYTVIGTDSVQCFNDTASVQVRIEEPPAVQGGPDQVLPTGSEVTLNARVSADVVGYKWAPADYLSCTTCPQPLAIPRKDIAYSVAVHNRFGCVAMDTISIILRCAEGKVFIPNAFTPDRDGLNETFSVKGRGVAQVKSFRIFDRWGKLVFQSMNTLMGDSKSAWDGTYDGRRAPAGTYVYLAELACDTGDVFVKKGTVTLIR